MRPRTLLPAIAALFLLLPSFSAAEPAHLALTVHCWWESDDLRCGEEAPASAPVATIPQATFYEHSLYSELGNKWVLWDVPGGCGIRVREYRLTSPDYQFWNNRISSIRVDDPQCRVAGWDIDVMYGPFTRCYSALKNSNEACYDMHPGGWGDRISAIWVEAAG